jgi:polar amino acid transport system permease protein
MSGFFAVCRRYVAVDDLFYAAQSIYSRTFETIPLLIVVAFWYLVAVTILSIGQGYLERYYGRMESTAPTGVAHRVWRAALAARHRSAQ